MKLERFVQFVIGAILLSIIPIQGFAGSEVYFTGDFETFILKYVQSARFSIDFFGYTPANKNITDAVYEKFRKGARIRLLVHSPRSEVERYASASLKAGVIPMETLPGKYHSRYIVIDARTVITGTFELGAEMKSQGESEMVILTDEPRLAFQYTKRFDEMWTTIPAMGVKPKETPAGELVANVRSKKYHRPGCKYLPSAGIRIYFKTRDEAAAKGYTPCKACNP